LLDTVDDLAADPARAESIAQQAREFADNHLSACGALGDYSEWIDRLAARRR
jgi:hypothetical protein